MSLSKQIDLVQKAVDFKERMIATMEMEIDEKHSTYNEMKELMAKIERLMDQMAELTEAHRTMNPIVKSVLQHASVSMGISSNRIDNNDGESYVESLVTNEEEDATQYYLICKV
jgi:transcription elongation GreA/GreB family factor